MNECLNYQVLNGKQWLGYKLWLLSHKFSSRDHIFYFVRTQNFSDALPFDFLGKRLVLSSSNVMRSLVDLMLNCLTWEKSMNLRDTRDDVLTSNLVSYQADRLIEGVAIKIACSPPSQLWLTHDSELVILGSSSNPRAHHKYQEEQVWRVLVPSSEWCHWTTREAGLVPRAGIYFKSFR